MQEHHANVKRSRLTMWLAGGLAAAATVLAGAGPADQPQDQPFTPPADWAVSPEQAAQLAAVLRATLSDPAPVGVDEATAAAAKIPTAVCFDPMFPPSPELMASVQAAMQQALTDFNSGISWNAVGTLPVHLTVSFVPDGTFIPANPGVPGDVAGPSNLFARFDAAFAAVGGRAAWTGAITAAFNRWAALTGTSYTFVADDGAPLMVSPGNSLRGDVRISGRSVGSGAASSVLAFNAFPPVGDMVFNTAKAFATGAPGFITLRNTASHEHGHGLGLFHVCPGIGTKLMEPQLSTGFDGPQHDDLRGVHSLYGDAFEPNLGPFIPGGTSTFLGTITINGQVLASPSTVPAPAVALGSRTCIQDFFDEDWFRFSLNTTWNVSITVTPVGTNYASGLQNNDGTCSNGTNLNSASQANLGVEVYRIGFLGTADRVASATARGRGQSESITVSLGPTGTCFGCNNGWFIKVFSQDVPSGPQLYTLSVSGTSPLTLSASDGEFTNQVRLSWPEHGGQRFNVLRNTTSELSTAEPIAANISNGRLVDTSVVRGQTYYYWLQNMSLETGPEVMAGPATGYAR